MGALKIVGIVFLVISVIGLILGLVLAVGLPWGLFLGPAMSADEYDSWVGSSSRVTGDQQDFRGSIGEKESSDLFGETFYSYKFKDCDEGFLSTEDIGDEGDYVLITIEYGQLGPEARAKTNFMMCAVPGIILTVIFLIFTIIAVILVVVGVKLDKKKKAKLEAEKPAVQESATDQAPAQADPYANQNLYGASGAAPNYNNQNLYGQQGGTQYNQQGGAQYGQQGGTQNQYGGQY